MRQLLEIALHDLRIFLTSPGNLIGLLAIPIGMTVLLGIFIPSGQGPSRVRLDVINHDRGPVSVQLLQAIRQANASIVLCPMDNDTEDFCELGEDPALNAARGAGRVTDGVSLALIEIPSGFTARVQATDPVELRYLSREELTAPGFIRQAVEAALTQINGAVVAAQVGSEIAQQLRGEPPDPAFPLAVYQRAADLWHGDPVRVELAYTAQETVDPTSRPDIGGFGQSVPGIGSMFVLFTVLGGMAALVGEKKQWTLQRLATTPVSRGQLLGGKIAGRFVLGAVQYLVVFAVGLVAGLDFGSDLLALVLVMLAFTLACTALSFAVGNLIKSEQQAAGLSNLLGLTLAPLGGAWWPLDIVPRFMRLAGHVSPVAWAMDGYSELMFRNGTLEDVVLPILVLLAMGAALFAVGILRFRYE